MSTKKIAALFTSARSLNKKYKDLAFETGKAVARAGYDGVYGGGEQGLMGRVARGVREGGKKIFGITTFKLLGLELSLNYKQDTTHFVHTMGERKEIILSMSSIVVILPGGFGTMDELFEALTFDQLNIADNKIIILDPELAPVIKDLFKVLIKRGTVSQNDIKKVHFVDTVEELEKKLKDI